jgi:hypothetical protein
MQEPPIPQNHWRIPRLDGIPGIVTQDVNLQDERYIHSHGALPWHVNKSYDQLVKTPPPEKNSRLSWITSNKAFYPGHHHRLRFLRRVQQEVEFDLWGRGFTPIADKWDGLAPYQYSLAIENYQGPDYWTEKVADCFLSWTMPIYFGCTNLSAYFPEESFIHIDIHARDVSKQINAIIKSNRWQKSLEAIAHARELVLNRYQLFPFVADLIQRQCTQASVNAHQTPDLLTFKGAPKPYDQTPLQQLRYFMGRVRAKLKNS